jgi:hypothetical protein
MNKNPARQMAPKIQKLPAAPRCFSIAGFTPQADYVRLSMSKPASMDLATRSQTPPQKCRMPWQNPDYIGQ